MASNPPRASCATSDTMIPAAPFAQAVHPWLKGYSAAKPSPEKPKTNATLFYEDQCKTVLIRFYDNTRELSERVKDALGISALLIKIRDEDLAEECAITLVETMQEDSEHPSLRMACAVSLGSSGVKGFVQEMEDALKSEASSHSKILALKALSICRSDEAIELLGMEAQYGDVDEVCFAAAKELANIPLYRARKIVKEVISNPPQAYMRHPEFAAELKRMVSEWSECYLPTN